MYVGNKYITKTKMSYASYRSSPIRNLQPSQVVRERFEDEFFQIKCTRLEKQNKDLEDEISLLNAKLRDSGSKTQEIILLNARTEELAEQNQRLRLTIEQLGAGTLPFGLRAKEIYNSRQRVQLEYKRQIENLLRLYETAKAQTALFKSENQRLKNIELRRSRGSEMQDLGKSKEISKLRINVANIETENVRLKCELESLQREIQRLTKLYNYEKKRGQQKEKEHRLLLSHAQETSKSEAKNNYFSVQGTPVRTIMKDTDANPPEEQTNSLAKRFDQLVQQHQILMDKHSALLLEHEQAIRQRDQLRAVGQYTLRETARENIVQRSRHAEQTKGERASNGEVERLKRQLKEKEEQIRSILERFAPLLKIQAGQISLEEDRKQRMDKHWKADLSILDVLLNKYRIQILKHEGNMQ